VIPLRLRITLILAAINIATWSALGVYVVAEGRRIRSDLLEQTRRLQESVADAVSSQLTQLLEFKVAERLAEVGPGARRLLPIELQKIAFWDDPAFRRYVQKAVVIRERADGNPEVFHPRSELVFDHGTFEPGEALDLVRRAASSQQVAFRGTRAAGPIRVGGERWGGGYLSVLDASREFVPFDPFEPLRRVIVIAVLGTLILAGVIYLFLAGSVIRPLEELGAVATAAAQGDWSRRVTSRPRSDEVGNVVEAQNRMMALIEDYSANMENRVREGVDLVEKKTRELVIAQRLAAIGTLAAGIAHEINNPLGGMLNAVVRLRRSDLPAESREKYLALLEENIERIGTTVRRALDLVPRKTTPGPVALLTAAQRAIDLATWRAQKKGVAMHVDVAGAVRDVLGDQNEIVQVLLNLLVNAIDATDAAGSVTIRLSEAGAWVEAAVTDTGAGIPPDVLARVFDPFFTTKEAGAGTGLGLAIVHGLVTSLGGTIAVSSEPGRGTTFTLRFRPAGAASA
jgi:signal transduction histidine kinase